VKLLTIGQLAKAAQVPTSTVRFYERRGLIGADARTTANYRTFTPQTLERLRFIRAAQASGFSLKDVREMLGLAHFDEPPCEEVARLIEHRLSDVRQRVKELRRVEKALATALQSCCKGGPDWCTKIERLKGGNGICKKPARRALTLH
jgi:MerR family mercuric resistance operon transcriptional regulator